VAYLNKYRITRQSIYLLRAQKRDKKKLTEVTLQRCCSNKLAKKREKKRTRNEQPIEQTVAGRQGVYELEI
jgi:hypothetical protein